MKSSACTLQQAGICQAAAIWAMGRAVYGVLTLVSVSPSFYSALFKDVVMASSRIMEVYLLSSG